jgi:hypothetical protein
MKKSKGLDLNVQLSLGKQLGDCYDDILQKFPLRFHDLLRRLGIQAAQGPIAKSTVSILQAAHSNSTGILNGNYFDPETLAKLEAAFEEAWSSLKQIGNENISREMLAQRLLELASEENSNPDRLASRAIISLIRSS